MLQNFEIIFKNLLKVYMENTDIKIDGSAVFPVFHID